MKSGLAPSVFRGNITWHPESLIRETWIDVFLKDVAFCPDEGPRSFVVAGDEGVDVAMSSGTLWEDAPPSDLPVGIEIQISIWLSQEECVGV